MLRREPHPEMHRVAGLLRTRGVKRVLDLGSGGGRHTIYLASIGFDVYGLDLDSYALSRYVRPYAHRVEDQILSDLGKMTERISKLKWDLQQHGGMEEQVRQLEAVENLLFFRAEEEKTRVIQELFGLSRNEVLELLGSRQAVPSTRRISSAMASELEPWKHVLRNREYSVTVERASRYMERTAVFPALTEMIIGRAWRSWT